MNEKEKILESWIMVEHLSEGDINTKEKSIRIFPNPEDENFHAFFCREIQKKKFPKWKKGGLVVYFDIFNFEKVVSILRKEYGLQPTHEEIRLGDKFSFALYFDKNLKLNGDMTFVTESAYIRCFKKIPHEKEFCVYEKDLKEFCSQIFEDTSENPEQFNEAMRQVMKKYSIDIKNCRFQLLDNLETDATNLHSFFIGDLEKAKKIRTENLENYLSGEHAGRVNLDSNSSSSEFNPGVFREILQPKNYPAARFPSNTKYALSLMQQVVVNLSIGYDNNQIRSVNGPPGTGKTTLLKDIFAELVVQQASDISELKNREIKGNDKTIYYGNASIGELPDGITENNIVVASSNNGAVQNIVNELPLIKGADEALAEEIKNADYFYELSNAKLTAEWKEDEEGKRYEELVMAPEPGESKFWGLFSLEGGKADNMTNIITSIKHIYHYLENEYIPDADIYEQFKEQYREVQALRESMQEYSEWYEKYRERSHELERIRISFQADRENREQVLESEIRKQKETIEHCSAAQKMAESQRKDMENRRAVIEKNRDSIELYLKTLKEQKPGLFAGRAKKAAFQCRLNEGNEQLLECVNASRECDDAERELREQIKVWQSEITECLAEQQKKKQSLDDWICRMNQEIMQLEGQVNECREKISCRDVKVLDMNLPYDKLQLSNPWFDESYRIAQSKLFIAALRVRKQFLYENRKNVKAATIIWNKQNEYLDKKPVIVAAWNWLNMAIPVISSTFASFSRMCKNLDAETLGHLFIDEAGQALPQASVGAIYRSRHVMVVGDPSQIIPVLTLDSNVLRMLRKHFDVTEKYLSASASAQTLVDSVSRYGFYREQDSWIGIPLWVHRRCQYPMFTISNEISYNGFMVQGVPEYGKTGWYDIGGKADNKYVKEQGEFLVKTIRDMIEENPKITDKKEKDIIYVISPFANVAYCLAQELKKINFTRYDDHGKPTNVGTIHTFQGKEAPIVFMVLGADSQCSGAARWAVAEPNMMNVAATRAKKEFYVIGDLKLYLGLGCDVATDTYQIIRQYIKQHPDLVENA